MDKMLHANLAYANLIMCIGVVFIVISLWSIRRIWKLEAFNYPQEVSALLLWTIWWISLIVVYILVPGVALDKRGWVLGGILLLLDIGNVSGLAFVIAYSQGHQFKWRQLEPLLTILVFFGAWDLFSSAFLTGAKYRMLVIAPSAIIAHVFIVGVGWIFFVRWGVTALPFFVLTILYAIGQLPAYFDLFVVIPFELQHTFASPREVFYLLALGKLMYACGFFAMFFSPPPFRPDMSGAKYVPADIRVRLHPRIWKSIVWGLGMLVTIIATAVIVAVSDKISKAIKEFITVLSGVGQ